MRNEENAKNRKIQRSLRYVCACRHLDSEFQLYIICVGLVEGKDRVALSGKNKILHV